MDIFTLLGILYLMSIAAADHCTLSDTEKNKMVDSNYTGDDAIVTLLGSVNMMTSSDCINTCCHTDDCNVAVFDSRDGSNTSYNCFMYKCEGCKLKKKNKFTSYFINDEKSVETTEESTLNSDAKSTLTSSTSSTTPPENNNSPEFDRIVLNRTAVTMVAPATVPEVENSVKGETLQESEIDIPLVMPDLPATLDDSQVLDSGSTETVQPTQTSNDKSPDNLSPIVPGSATSSGSSATSGTQGGDIESKPSTKTTDDSMSLNSQTNTDTSPTSDNAPSEKPTTDSGADTPGSKNGENSPDTAPPSATAQTDSTNSAGDSTITNSKPSTDTQGQPKTDTSDKSTVSQDVPDTASSSGSSQTDSSQSMAPTDTVVNTAVSGSVPSADTSQTDSPNENPSTKDATVSNAAASPDTAPPSDATQTDKSSENPTSNPNPPSSDTSEKATTKSTSSGSASDTTGAENDQTKETSSSDIPKTPPSDSTTSSDAASADHPPTETSGHATGTSNPATISDQSSDSSAQPGSTGNQAATAAEETGSTGTIAPTADGLNSKKEEMDTQQDLPDTYDAPYVNHPNIVSAALIAALSFGVLFFFAVTAIVGKRCYDGWQRRHYSRVDYLINGIYN